MKPSKYNLIVKADDSDKYILFNQISSAILIINEEYKKLIENIFSKQSINSCDIDNEVLEKLTIGKYLINDDEDELVTMESNNNTLRYSCDSLNLTILPTLACNFNCTYCYENHNSEIMNQETVTLTHFDRHEELVLY